MLNLHFSFGVYFFNELFQPGCRFGQLRNITEILAVYFHYHIAAITERSELSQYPAQIQIAFARRSALSVFQIVVVDMNVNDRVAYRVENFVRIESSAASLFCVKYETHIGAGLPEHSDIPGSAATLTDTFSCISSTPKGSALEFMY